MNKKRCVEVYPSRFDAHSGADALYVGSFHGFSISHEEYTDAGPGHFPVAIVEKTDGTVDVVYAERIRFIDVCAKG